MIGSKKLNTINNTNISGIYKEYIYKEYITRVKIRAKQSCSKASVGAKKEDCETITVATKEKAIKRTFSKDLQYFWNFTFSSILYILMDSKRNRSKDLNLTLSKM